MLQNRQLNTSLLKDIDKARPIEEACNIFHRLCMKPVIHDTQKMTLSIKRILQTAMSPHSICVCT